MQNTDYPRDVHGSKPHHCIGSRVFCSFWLSCLPFPSLERCIHSVVRLGGRGCSDSQRHTVILMNVSAKPLRFIMEFISRATTTGPSPYFIYKTAVGLPVLIRWRGPLSYLLLSPSLSLSLLSHLLIFTSPWFKSLHSHSVTFPVFPLLPIFSQCFYLFFSFASLLAELTASCSFWYKKVQKMWWNHAK